MSGKCKVESGQCRNCVAIVTPSSDEGDEEYPIKTPQQIII